MQVTELLNSWWGLSTTEQETIKNTVPDKGTWILPCTKHESGVWTFSLPEYATYNESLCNGTEEALDYYYQVGSSNFDKEAVTGSTMYLEVTSTKPQTYSTEITWMGEDEDHENSNYYIDEQTGMSIWLCPYLQVLFKDVPKKLWVTFTPSS